MKKTIKFALIKTVPIMLGYIFLGIAYGILLQNAGYNAWWAALTSSIIYAGSMQFVLIGMLSAHSALGTIAIMTMMVNSRHIFYGLSLIEKFKDMGKFKPYMIFSLSDETYSLLCSAEIPDDIKPKRALFFMAIFDQLYWICGSVIGAVAGSLIPFDFTGIDFAMTALFVVIFIEQYKSAKCHIPAYVGGGFALFFLILLGPDKFILPALVATVAVLIFLKPYILIKSEATEND